MSNAEEYKEPDPPVLHEMKARSNRRRLVMFMVLIFIILISFFAGRYTYHRPLMKETVGNYVDSTGRQGIPPDSLTH